MILSMLLITGFYQLSPNIKSVSVTIQENWSNVISKMQNGLFYRTTLPLWRQKSIYFQPNTVSLGRSSRLLDKTLPGLFLNIYQKRNTYWFKSWKLELEEISYRLNQCPPGRHKICNTTSTWGLGLKATN